MRKLRVRERKREIDIDTQRERAIQERLIDREIER